MRTPLLTHTCTSRTRPRLLNIETKENFCILSRPTSFDCSSTAVGNNAQALLINQGERIPLRGKLKGATRRAIYSLTGWLTDWLNDWLQCAVVPASCLTQLLFPRTGKRGRASAANPCITPSSHTLLTILVTQVRYQPEVSTGGM